jgi:hypothetical protein
VLAVLAAYLALLLAASNNSIGAAPELARTLFYLDWEYAGVFCPAFGALVGASSLGIVRGGVLPRRLRWLGWIGVPLAVALGLSGFLGGFLAWLSLIWLIALAVSLAFRRSTARTTPWGRCRLLSTAGFRDLIAEMSSCLPRS